MRCEEPYEAMPRRSLYHLETDPDEEINLADYTPDQVRAMDDLVDRHVADVTGGRPDPLRAQQISRRLDPPVAITVY